MTLQPPDLAIPAQGIGAAGARRTLDIVARVFASIGLALCALGAASSLATLLASGYLLSSYWWLAGVVAGVAGLWPALIGLVLGLVALVERRHHRERQAPAVWIIAIAVAGPVLEGAGFLALWLAT